MLSIDKSGHVFDARIRRAISPHIERGPLTKVRGLIVHQTGGTTAKSSLGSYAKPKANGAHFLIDRDGKIYQTAWLFKQTWHVGSLRARCIAEYRCTKVELKSLRRFNPRAEHRNEWQSRYRTVIPQMKIVSALKLSVRFQRQRVCHPQKLAYMKSSINSRMLR